MNHFPASEHTPELIGQISAEDFDATVEIEFEDGSTFRSEYAFAHQEGEDGKYTVVYTEHCGYHVFWSSTIENVVVTR